MIWLVGWKTFSRHLWAGKLACRYCLRLQPHELIQKTEWGTVFFLPVVPLRRERLLICLGCGFVSQLTKQQTEQFLNEETSQSL